MKTKNLVVGCGISGATIAAKLARDFKEEVMVIEKRNCIGGNCFDYHIENILIHKYGPHIFHTNNEKVWKFISEFTDWHIYMHEVMAVVEGKKVNIPFNLDSIYEVFPPVLAERIINEAIAKLGYGCKVPILELFNCENSDLNLLANYIYQHVFLHYTSKQWGKKPEEVDGAVTARVPLNISRDRRYFQDKYQGIPKDGYTKLIENMLNNPKIKVFLNTDFKDIKREIEFERLFYTGPIDEFFEYEFGGLPYRSIAFKLERIDKPYYQEKAVINYPNNYDFTRITEFKHFQDTTSEFTYIMKEFPQQYIPGVNEPYYAITSSESACIYQQYLNKVRSMKNIWFLGRLGDYRYYDMDDAVERALTLVETLYSVKENSND